MIKTIIIVIIFVIYSIAIFLCGRGFGIEEVYEMTRNLIQENIDLKNKLQSITNSKMQNKNIKNTVIPPQPKLNIIKETYSPLNAIRNPNYKKI